MSGLANWLFNPSGLTAHGFCLLWEPGLIWLHAISDTGIALAYFAIPFILGRIIRRRPDLVFRPVVVLFAGFILLCGTGHALDVLTLWVPAYGVEGVVKALTATISIVTAFVLWRLLPQALGLPSPLQMREARADVLARRRSEERLAEELARRAETERALRESEGRFRLLLQSNLAEALYLMDPQGNIETWNAGAERIKGYTPEEVIGRNFSMFFTPGDIAAGAPELALARARETGYFAAESWRVHKDGVLFLASVAIDAIYHDDGTLRGFVKVTLDLTRQRVEEAQRRIIIEAAPNGLMTVDEAGIITLANSEVARIFDHSQGTLVGMPVGKLIEGGLDDAPSGPADATQLFPGSAVERQVTGRRRDGSTVTIEMKLSPVSTPRGSIVVVSLADVTRRVAQEAERLEADRNERQAMEMANANLDRLARHLSRARDRAERANRAKSHFLAGMSHELRTPLNAILGYAHLLKMDGGFTPIQNDRLASMLSASRHLLEMITCVLDLSEIEAEHVTLRPAALDVRAVGEACLDLVRPAAQAKHLSLRLVVEPATHCLVFVDPTRFRQVLVNLLGNAVKFTQHGAVALRLRDSADGTALRLDVVDTGPGIAPDKRDRLFRDFERLDEPGKVEGAGLGLALSSRLATLLGGRLGHEDNPAGGSIFWLEVPHRYGATEPAADAVETGGETLPTGSLRVLVADDVAMNCDIAASFLRAAGHQVTCVDGGEEAVEAVASATFDVVLMDVRMPGVDGLEATRRIRALQGAGARVPVIGLTAYAFSEQVAKCREAGMDGHLAKPYEPETLISTVARTVSRATRQVAGDASADPRPSVPAAVRQATPAASSALDTVAFDRACAVLKPEATAAYLEKIGTMCDTLLGALRTGDEGLGAVAHTLAGSAGMFGFAQLAQSGRAYEYAIETGSGDVAAVTRALCSAIEAAKAELARVMPSRAGGKYHPTWRGV